MDVNFCSQRNRVVAGSQIVFSALLLVATQTWLLSDSPLTLNYDNSVLEGAISLK